MLGVDGSAKLPPLCVSLHRWQTGDTRVTDGHLDDHVTAEFQRKRHPSQPEVARHFYKQLNSEKSS